MSLIKTSLLNGIAVAIKLGSALALNKLLAVYVGPAGYAIIGQFQNVISIVMNLAGGLVAAGVTKTTAQHFDDETKQHKIWQTAIRFSMIASLLIGVILLIFNQKLSIYLLHRNDMSSIFVWLALALPAIAANNLLLAIVNGKKEVAIYIASNITGSLASLVLIGLLSYSFGLYGALLALTINPAIVLFCTAALVTRRSWFRPNLLLGVMDKSSLNALSGFALMGLTSALVVPLSYMLIRDHLSSRLGLTAAGYWQASWKISEIYLMLITSTLSIYYLPRIAEIKTSYELKKEILKVYRFAMPVVILGAIAIYSLRDYIIQILFTSDFQQMEELFALQLIGDVIKVGAWILAYIMIGRSMVKKFVFSEIIFSIFFVLLSWLMIDFFGLKGVALAYALNYSFYWIAMIYLIKIEIANF